MKRSILIIIALVQIAFGQPFFNQGGLDINSVDNGIEFTGGKAGLGGALNRNTSIALSGNTLQFTGIPSNAAASRLLVEDGTGVLGWMDKSALNQPYTGTIVYVNTVDPNSATVFDTINPPAINRPSFIGLQRILYLGTDNSTWVYNGSLYVTTASIDKTPFMLANTTADAGGNKNNGIYRYGRLGLGHDNPQTLLDIRTNASDTEATINLYNTSSTPSSQSRLLMRSYNHAASITTGQSNTAKGEADGLTIGVMSSADDISFKVGDAVSGTATAYPMILQHDGNVGIGVNSATNALHIKSANDPLRVVGLTSGSAQDSILTVNVNGVVFQQDKSRLIQDAWNVNGNSVAPGKFIGTTNDADLVLKRNNIEKVLFSGDNTTFRDTVVLASYLHRDSIASFLANNPGHNSLARLKLYDVDPGGILSGTGPQEVMRLCDLGGGGNEGGLIVFGSKGDGDVAAMGGVTQSLGSAGRYGGALYFYTRTGNTTTKSLRMIVSDTGRVGVGTGSPRQTLHAITRYSLPPSRVGGNSEDAAFAVSPPLGTNRTSMAMGVSSTAATAYSWIQSRSLTHDSVARNIHLNPIGGAVAIGTRTSVAVATSRFQVTSDFNATLDSSMIFTTGGLLGVGTIAPTSTLHVNGSQSQSTTINSLAITLGIAHSVIIHTGAAVTYTLPAANTCTGREYTIANHGTGTITFSLPIRTDGSNTTTTLSQFGGANVYRIISDGTQWRKIN